MSPTLPQLSCEFFRRIANYSHEQDKYDRFTHDHLFFTDEEANAVPHQEADERVHGVEPDREAQDHRGDPRDAQRRDLQSPWQTLATALSSRDSFQKIVNCMFTILAISLALTKAQRITNFCSGGTRPVHRRGRASEVAPHDRVP